MSSPETATDRDVRHPSGFRHENGIVPAPRPPGEWLAFLTLTGLSALIGYATARLSQDLLTLTILLIPVSIGAWRWGVAGGQTGCVAALAAWAAARVTGAGSPAGLDLVSLGLLAMLLCAAVAIIVSCRTAQRRSLSLSQTEPWTGLLNRNGFLVRLESEVARSHRHRHPLAVLYLDIDNFKSFNDSRGHVAGDDLLRRISQVLRAATRSYDAIARLGGDEFAVLYPEISAENATQAAERLQTSLRQLSQGPVGPVTFSMGLVTSQTAPPEACTLIAAADELMYRARSQARIA